MRVSSEVHALIIVSSLLVFVRRVLLFENELLDHTKVHINTGSQKASGPFLLAISEF